MGAPPLMGLAFVVLHSGNVQTARSCAEIRIPSLKEVVPLKACAA